MPPKRYDGGLSQASPAQQGRAADLRNSAPMDRSDILTLNRIVHSSDKMGKFASTPNPYRDTTSSYDPRAQQALDAIEKKYR